MQYNCTEFVQQSVIFNSTIDVCLMFISLVLIHTCIFVISFIQFYSNHLFATTKKRVHIVDAKCTMYSIYACMYLCPICVKHVTHFAPNSKSCALNQLTLPESTSRNFSRFQRARAPGCTRTTHNRTQNTHASPRTHSQTSDLHFNPAASRRQTPPTSYSVIYVVCVLYVYLRMSDAT